MLGEMLVFSAVFTLVVVTLFFLLWDLVNLCRNYLGEERGYIGVLVEKRPPTFPPLLALLVGTILYHGSRHFRIDYPLPRCAYYLIFEIKGQRRKLLAAPDDYDRLQVGKRYRLTCQGDRLLSAKVKGGSRR